MGKLVKFNRLTSGDARLRKSGHLLFRRAFPDTLRGPNISGLWFDEAQGTPLEAFNIALGCLREDPELEWPPQLLSRAASCTDV